MSSNIARAEQRLLPTFTEITAVLAGRRRRREGGGEGGGKDWERGIGGGGGRFI